jgi:hypothetical protein
MQRLFSMFPLGSAGLGLFLLRLSAAGMLLTISFPRAEVTSSELAFAALAVLAACLVLGVFTPIVCTLGCCLEIAVLVSLRGAFALHLLFSLVDMGALGLLGPGGYSLDARMFGRRRVVLSSGDGSDIS